MRHYLAAGLLIVVQVVFRHPLAALADLSLHDDRSTHILVIPLISASLIFLRRKHIFSRAAFSPAPGLALLGIALAGRYALQFGLSIAACAIVLSAMAIFLLCYGRSAFRAAAFPLFLLVLIIPIPAPVIDRAVFALQKGSADTSYFLFRMIGVPVTMQGFQLSLPGVQIEIAEQCSSIRSSLSLFITSLLAGHFFLSSPWKKAALCLLSLPIAVFKNAIRIVTISWLGIYWDPNVFYGAIHRHGGLPFSLVGLALLGLSLFVLERPLFLSKAR